MQDFYRIYQNFLTTGITECRVAWKDLILAHFQSLRFIPLSVLDGQDICRQSAKRWG